MKIQQKIKERNNGETECKTKINEDKIVGRIVVYPAC
jgi:F0F1-type ATP synthase delta subunit